MTSNGVPEVQLSAVEDALIEALELIRTAPREGLTALQWLDIAAKVGDRLAIVREASSNVREALIGGARTAILAFLRGHVGQAIPPQELEGVSGIREWARRIRELRAMGWDIECMGSGPTARYRLMMDRLAEDQALGDQLISKLAGDSPRGRLLEYLLHISPWPATARQLERVAGVSTWRQDIATLIDEGWMIRSRADDPAVPVDGYRLVRVTD